MRNRRPYKRPLRLDKEHRKFLGVCAGVADYLEVEPWSVRMVFLVSIFFGGWFLVPIYFIAWFCLDDKAGEGFSGLSNSQTMKHFRTVDYRKKLYRNTEDGKFLGVCAGVADYLEVNVFAVRLFFLGLVFFTAMLPILLYFGAYFILEEKPHARLRRAGRERMSAVAGEGASGRRRPPEPGMKEGPLEEDEIGEGKRAGFRAGAYSRRKEFKSYSKRREFKYCARKFSTLQDRLARLEAYVTSKQFRLHREFKNI